MTNLTYYFFDSCAIARYYCNDVGTSIVTQLIDNQNGDGLLMSNLSTVEVVSALTQMKQANHHSFGQAKLNLAIAHFQQDAFSKFVQIPMNDIHFNKAIDDSSAETP